jgi:outer membrane protein TolC
VRTFLIMLITILALPVAARADAERVSLREAIEQALGSDHQLKAAGHRGEAAAAELASSRTRYLPRVFLEEGAVATNSATRSFMFKLDEGRFAFGGDLNRPGTTGDFRTTLSLEQPLLDFGLAPVVDQARAGVRAEGFVVARSREETAFQVYAAYLEVQRARAHLRVTEQAVADAVEHGRLAAVRAKNGVGLRADELRARTFLSQRELERITASNNLRLAQLRLARRVGRTTGSVVDTREDVQMPAVAFGDADLVRLALERRPELQEAAADADRAASGMKAARSAYLPTVYGMASYQMNDRDIPFGRDNDSWTVGATLRWELFDGLRRGHGVERARAEKGVAEERLAQRREEIALEVEAEYLRRAEAGKRLEVIRHALLDAEEDVRLVTKRFENSLATIVELLDAQTAINGERAQLADAEVATAMATARLYHAAGIFLQEVMK